VNAIGGSECEPRKEKQSVIPARVVAEAVIVFRTAVELGVDGVLDAKLQVGEGSAPRVVFAERHPISLDDEAVAVRFTVGAAAERLGGEQGGVRVAPSVLPSEVETVGVPIEDRRCSDRSK
jgi:hypothetical protein